MKKALLLLVVLFLFNNASGEAKIQADQDFDGAVAFYCWDDFKYHGGMGAGGVWITFVKYIYRDGSLSYWIRIDSMRRDKLLQHHIFDVSGIQTKINQVDSAAGKYLRVGIRGRSIPGISIIKAFIDVPADVMTSLAAGHSTAVVLNFQGRDNMRFELSSDKLKKIITLRDLTIEDFNKYK